MVKDINSGSGSSSPLTSRPLATPSISEPTTEPMDRIVEERWNVLRHGDGQGHQRAEVIAVLPTNSQVGNTIYFVANDRNQRTELWKSDGTTSGTVMVKDINGK